MVGLTYYHIRQIYLNYMFNAIKSRELICIFHRLYISLIINIQSSLICDVYRKFLILTNWILKLKRDLKYPESVSTNKSVTSIKIYESVNSKKIPSKRKVFFFSYPIYSIHFPIYIGTKLSNLFFSFI